MTVNELLGSADNALIKSPIIKYNRTRVLFEIFIDYDGFIAFSIVTFPRAVYRVVRHC